MRAPVAVAQTAVFGIHLGNGGTGMQLALACTRLVQQREQGPALHAQAVQARIQSLVAHVHHRALARRVAIQAVHRRGMCAHGIKQAHLPQYLQATGLQQETGTHRPRRGHAFEDLHLVAVTGEQDGHCLSSGAVADHGDAQSFRHGRIVPEAGGSRAGRGQSPQKKNPAEAGFSTHCRVDHSAGVMFEAWAPFGPWVTS